jgi:GBP family porin
MFVEYLRIPCKALWRASANIALAALAATASFAQSSVTLYGQFDAGVYSLNKANGTDSRVVYGDGATFSNVWGMRGSEDLGGGLKANFNLESDIQTNNGGLNQYGLFRRQANVSVGGNFGEVKVGITTNPLIATNGLLMPVSGNSVSTATSSAMGYADFYTKNAVTYTSPSLSGLTAQLQYGFSNNIESAGDGSVTAGSLAYVNGPLAIRYAFQDRKEAAAGTANSGANPSTSDSVGIVSAAPGIVAGKIAAAKKSQLVGARYEMGAVSLGLAYLENKAATTLGGPLAKVTGYQAGVGYTTGAWLLGATYTRSEKSSLTNLQARYSLSKRTSLIAQAGFADNSVDGKVNFAPIAFNTGSSPATITDTYAATTGVKQSGIGLALAHSF